MSQNKRIAGSMTVAAAACVLFGVGGLGCMQPHDNEVQSSGAPSGVKELKSVDDPLLHSILEPLLASHEGILRRPEDHRLQILLSVPSQDADGSWVLERHAYRVDAEYFYPASTVKTAAAVAVLEALHGKSWEGPVGLETPLMFYPQFEQETPVSNDASNLDGEHITIGHEIRKLFLVSDNEAYNRMFELAGRDAVNASMHRLGLSSFHLVHRLAESRSGDENRQFPRVDFLDREGTRIGGVPARSEALAQSNVGADEAAEDLLLGRAFYTAGELIEEPFDFSTKNRASLRDLQDLTLHLTRPDLLPVGPRLKLIPDHLHQVELAMSQLPSESENPEYATAEVPDDYVKYLRPGLERVVPGRTRIYNKVGRAYGFSIENAYVVDLDSFDGGLPQRSFFLNVVLYTNANQTLNDDDYEYEAADAFLADLGESVARVLWRSE